MNKISQTIEYKPDHHSFLNEPKNMAPRYVYNKSWQLIAPWFPQDIKRHLRTQRFHKPSASPCYGHAKLSLVHLISRGHQKRMGVVENKLCQSG